MTDEREERRRLLLASFDENRGRTLEILSAVNNSPGKGQAEDIVRGTSNVGLSDLIASLENMRFVGLVQSAETGRVSLTEFGKNLFTDYNFD